MSKYERTADEPIRVARSCPENTDAGDNPNKI